jgi:hypothetical protein
MPVVILYLQLLEATSARAVLSPEEELVLLIAAICHDLDHDGYTNSFHIYSQSQLAQQYNDKSGTCTAAAVHMACLDTEHI